MRDLGFWVMFILGVVLLGQDAESVLVNAVYGFVGGLLLCYGLEGVVRGIIEGEND